MSPTPVKNVFFFLFLQLNIERHCLDFKRRANKNDPRKDPDMIIKLFAERSHHKHMITEAGGFIEM